MDNDRDGAATRDELEEWVSWFLWEFEDSGMGNGEAAEIIVATLETHLQASAKTQAGRLTPPPEIFREYERRMGRI